MVRPRSTRPEVLVWSSLLQVQLQAAYEDYEITVVERRDGVRS